MPQRNDLGNRKTSTSLGVDESAGSCPEYNRNAVTAGHFCNTLEANVDNTRLTDAEFRQLVRNTLPIVAYDRIGAR